MLEYTSFVVLYDDLVVDSCCRMSVPLRSSLWCWYCEGYRFDGAVGCLVPLVVGASGGVLSSFLFLEGMCLGPAQFEAACTMLSCCVFVLIYVRFIVFMLLCMVSLGLALRVWIASGLFEGCPVVISIVVVFGVDFPERGSCTEHKMMQDKIGELYGACN